MTVRVYSSPPAFKQALERLRALKTPLPKGFRFDRDEANAR